MAGRDLAKPLLTVGAHSDLAIINSSKLGVVPSPLPDVGELRAGRRRTLVLPEPLVASLRRYRERQAAERAAARVWSDPRLVFATPIGTPLDPSNDARAFQALLNRAGVRRVRLHDLRHTAASLLLAQGLHPCVGMEILGHSQFALTMNTYGHVMPSLLGEAARSMETALWGEKS